MSVIAAALKELMTAGVTGDALVTAIERIERAAVPKKSSGAARQARYRERHQEASQSVTVTSRDVTPSPPSMVSPITPSLTTPPPSAPYGADEKGLFERGREILGAKSGGFIAKLLASKNRDVALARAALEVASTKQNPREYLGGVIAGNGKPAIVDQDWTRAIV